MSDLLPPASTNTGSHINAFPTELLSRAFRTGLTVMDRFRCERVSPLWKKVLQKWGWIEQRKLDYDIVFEGASDENLLDDWLSLGEYLEDLDEGSCYLTSIFHRVSQDLMELDVCSFEHGNLKSFVPKFIESLPLFSKLEKLNIKGFNLIDFVGHLPPTLCELKTSGEPNVQSLQALSVRCPNLEEVPFHSFKENNANLDAVIELIGKFPRQKSLDFSSFSLPSKKQGALAVIGQLKWLQKLFVWNCGSVDKESFGAIIKGCLCLQKFQFNTRQLTEKTLFQLVQVRNLTALTVNDEGEEFSDAVLRTIAQRGQLKSLFVNGNSSLTDDSVSFLVERCRSLVSLSLYNCPQITARSIETVAAEVRRRHGSPLRTIPTDASDNGIFYFDAFATGIERVTARELIDGNPWFRFNQMDCRKII